MKKVERLKFISLGHTFFDKGQIGSALHYFMLAKYKPGIRKVGKALVDLFVGVFKNDFSSKPRVYRKIKLDLARGYFMGVHSSYRLLDYKIPDKQFIKLEEVIVENGFTSEMCILYKMVSKKIPADKLARLCETSIKKGIVEDVYFAYELSGKKIPKDKFIELGNVCLNEGNLNGALFAYKEAGVEIPRYKLIKFGHTLFRASVLKEIEVDIIDFDRYLVLGSLFHDTVHAYELAEYDPETTQVRDLFLKK